MSTTVKKRVAQVLLGLVALIIVMLGVALAYVSSDAFLERVRVIAVDSANEALDGTLTIDSIEGSVFSSLQIRGVRLVNPDGEPMVALDEISAKFDLWSALSRELDVSDIVVKNPIIYVIRSQGEVEWQHIVKPDDTASTPTDFDITIANAQILGGKIVYLDQDLRPETTRLQAEALVLPESQTLAGTALLKRLNLTASARIELAGATSVTVTTLISDVQVEGVPASTLDVSNIQIDLGDDIIAQIESLKLKDLLKAQTLKFTLNDATFRASGKAEIQKGINPLLKGLGAPELLVPVKIDASAEGTTLAPHATIMVDAGLGGTLKATLSTQGDSPDWSAEVDVKGLAPQLLLTPSPLDALVTGSAKFTGASFAPKTMVANGSLSLGPSRFDLYHLNSMSADITIADQKVTVSNLVLDTPYAVGTGSGSFALDSGEFDVAADLGRGKELPAALKKVLKDDTSLSGKLAANGRLALDAELPLNMLDRIELSANWDMKNFEAEDVRIPQSKGKVELSFKPEGDKKRIVANVDMTARSVKSRPLRLASLDAKVDARGLVKWPYEDPLALAKELGADVTLRVSGLDSTSVRASSADVTAHVAPAGKGRISWSLKGSGKSLRASDTSIAQIQTDLRGTAQINESGKGLKLVRSISVAGTAAVESVDAPGAKIEQAAIKVDLSGPLDSLKGDAHLAAQGIDVGTYDFDQLEAAIELKPGRVFEIEASGTQPEKIPAKFDATIKGSYRADFSGWDIDDVRIEAGEGGWVIENGASIDTERGIYAFDNVTLKHKEQSLRIDGSFYQGKKQDIEIEANNFALAEAPRQFGVQGVPEIEGRVSGKASAHGTAQDPVVTFDFVFTDLKYQDVGPFNLHVAGSYDRDKMEVTTFELDGYDQRLITAAARIPVHVETTGKYEIFWNEAFSVAAQSQGLEISKFRALVPAISINNVSGQVSFDLTLEGKLEEPKLDASLELVDLVANIPGEVDDLDIGPLGLVMNTKYRTPKGSTDGLTVDLKLRDLKGDGVSLRGTAAFPVARLIKDTLTGAPTEKLKASILKSPFSVALLMRDYDIQRLNISAVQKAKAAGTFNILLTVDGTPENPRGKLRGRLTGFGWDRFRDIFIDVDADLTEQVLELTKVRVEWDADEVLTGRATIPVPIQVLLGKKQLEDLPLDVEFNMPSLPIAKLSAVDYTFASIRGKMDAYISLKGSLTKPTITATAHIKDTLFANKKTGNLIIEATASDNEVSALIDVQHGTTSVATIRANAPVNLDVLQLAAGVEPRLPGPLSASLEANGVDVSGLFPPRILESMIDNVKGKLTSDLRVNGTWESPELAGLIKIKDLNAFFPSIGRKIEEASLHIEAADGGLNIVEFYAAENQGYVDAEGRIDLEQLAPTRVALTINLREFGTSGFTPMPTYVSASIWTSVDLTQPQKDIRVGINDLVVNVPENQQGSTHPLTLDGDIIIVDSSKKTTSPLIDAAATADSQAVSAKVQIDIAPGAQLKHPNAQISFQGNLAVDIAGTQTSVLGDITSTGGKIEVLGKQFRLDQGIVTFTGDSPPNPRIQAEASYIYDRGVADELGPASSGNPRAVIRVYGTALRPQMRMSSDPQLTESQIIYVLVSDRAPAVAQAGEEEGVASQAIAAASGLLSGMLKDRAKGVYPIDMLRLQTTEGNISGVEVGKYFGKDLFFSYEFVFGAAEGENTNEVRLEYQFAPRWLVGSRFGDQANGALFLYWNIY
jgi:autotransporter translocation and assembly factor TamB